MIEILTNLMKLQQVDNELNILENKNKDVPKRIEGIKLVLANKQQEYHQLQQNLTDLKKKNKLLEVDLKETEDKIAQLSSQLFSAKNNEQYKAFLKEIEVQKKTKTTIEDNIIETLEQIETTEKKIKTIEKELVETEKITNEKISELQREQEEIQRAINERLSIREGICAALGKNNLAIYDRIKKGKAGLAVVTIENERCGGCLNPIPAQKILEIRKNDKIYFCEYCGRIIVAPDSFKNQ